MRVKLFPQDNLFLSYSLVAQPIRDSIVRQGQQDGTQIIFNFPILGR